MRSGHAARNARLYAAVTAAINETEIAVLEAKYHYQFWRPITAIRNGDRDNNPTTERDPDWTPSTVTPMNPEYPCGNCIIAATVAADRGSDAEAARGSEASRQTPPGVILVANQSPIGVLFGVATAPIAAIFNNFRLLS